MKQLSLFDTIFIDEFAGGGGASTGIEMATGHPVDIAIDHDESAIMMHKCNHPYTQHYREDVWAVDPLTATRGRPVRLIWFSPDCKHFSKAKGAALVDKKIRGLAWVVLRWAAAVKPDVIMLENVEEFTTWGPVRKGKPIKKKAGQTYRKWKQQLADLGYKIDTKILCAADYGAPTIRKRFCLVARCDGKPIVFPERTHAPRNSEDVRSGKCKPWRSAAEVIDFSLPTYSIFESKDEIKEKYGVRVQRPLKPKTLRRIAKGVDKFVIKSADPFIVPIGYGERKGQAPRTHDIREPLPTVVSSSKHYYSEPKMTPYIMSNNENNNPRDLRDPVPTLTTGNRNYYVAPTVIQYHSEQTEKEVRGQHPADPMMTVTASDGQFAMIKTRIIKWDGQTNLYYWEQVRSLLNEYCGYQLADDEVLLLWINGAWYFISDIGLRMLTPREQYSAQGFPNDYIIDRDCYGNKISRAKQVEKCGNSVSPPMAEALVRANLPDECSKKFSSIRELHNEMVS